MYYLYMLECSNGSFYTGYTTDMVRRFKEHVQGTAKCKYTRSFPPKHIAACWEVQEALSCVLSCERAIKKISAQGKRALVKTPEAILDVLGVEANIVPCSRRSCGL